MRKFVEKIVEINFLLVYNVNCKVKQRAEKNKKYIK